MLRKNKHEKLPTLHDAAASNDVKAAKNCDLSKEGLNGRNTKGQTPLHMAIINDSSKMVAFLISQGANVNARNTKGQTPLHTAILYHEEALEITKLLLQSPEINLHVKIKTGKGHPYDDGKNFLTLDEYALSYNQPYLAQLIEEKMQEERLKQQMPIMVFDELKSMFKSLEEKIQPNNMEGKEEKIPEKSTVSMFGFRPGSN